VGAGLDFEKECEWCCKDRPAEMNVVDLDLILERKCDEENEIW
jgi:hypothetical protein